MTKLLQDIANKYDTDGNVTSYTGKYKNTTIATEGKPNPRNKNQTKTMLSITLRGARYVVEVFQARSKRINDAFMISSVLAPNKDAVEDMVDSYYRKIKNGSIYES